MAHSPEQISAYESKLDHFAELLSRDVPVPAIAERMGTGRGGAYRLLGVIRERLGAQAQ